MYSALPRPWHQGGHLTNNTIATHVAALDITSHHILAPTVFGSGCIEPGHDDAQVSRILMAAGAGDGQSWTITWLGSFCGPFPHLRRSDGKECMYTALPAGDTRHVQFGSGNALLRFWTNARHVRILRLTTSALHLIYPCQCETPSAWTRSCTGAGTVVSGCCYASK